MEDIFLDPKKEKRHIGPNERSTAWLNVGQEILFDKN